MVGRKIADRCCCERPDPVQLHCHPAIKKPVPLPAYSTSPLSVGYFVYIAVSLREKMLLTTILQIPQPLDLNSRFERSCKAVHPSIDQSCGGNVIKECPPTTQVCTRAPSMYVTFAQSLNRSMFQEAPKRRGAMQCCCLRKHKHGRSSQSWSPNAG